MHISPNKHFISNMDVLHHPTLGSLQGIRTAENVIQFLGLQYATLKDGLARAVLHQGPYPAGKGVATKHGPNVINPKDSCAREQQLIQGYLPFSELPQSDVDCLTLNLSLPQVCSESSKEQHDLPVLVFIHGGAFANGSSSHPHYNLAKITARAVINDDPIIAVGINYRVGIPGFLHSTELAAAGYKPNNGLDDQRVALRWIQQHIKGFGGDPLKVTLVGESAGAASALFHLQNNERLFHQVVAMGGSAFNRPRPYQRLQNAFDSLMGEWGVGHSTSAEKVERLLAAVKDEGIGTLGRKYGVGPIVDGELILHDETTFASLATQGAVEKLFPGIHYCKRIMMGACEADGVVWLNRLRERKDSLAEAIARNLRTHFDDMEDNLTSHILDAYGLRQKNTTLPLVRLGTDISFAVPARAFAEAWSSSGVPHTSAYLFHFDCPNPWDGPWKDHATHVLDIAFLFLNYEEQLSPAQRACGRRFANDLIGFVHSGSASWEMYSQKQSSISMRYFAAPDGHDDGSALITDTALSSSGRVGYLYSMDEGILDRVSKAWTGFMAGK